MKLGKRVGILTFLMIMLTMSVSMVFAAQAPASEKIRVMCYGDSNTWGWIPVNNGFPSNRYASDVRWTGVLQKELGSKYQIIEEGLNGRTAGVDDYANGLDESLTGDLNLNGRPTLLPALKTQLPLDVVVIMLGTNDVKPYLKQTPEMIGESIKKLVTIVTNSSMKRDAEWLTYKAPKVLVVAPAPVHMGASQGMNEMFKGGDKTSQELAGIYAQVARETGAEFFNAATLISAVDGIDGVHLSAAAHEKLGKALAQKIRNMAEK